MGVEQVILPCGRSVFLHRVRVLVTPYALSLLFALVLFQTIFSLSTSGFPALFCSGRFFVVQKVRYSGMAPRYPATDRARGDFAPKFSDHAFCLHHIHHLIDSIIVTRQTQATGCCRFMACMAPTFIYSKNAWKKINDRYQTFDSASFIMKAESHNQECFQPLQGHEYVSDTEQEVYK